MDFIKKNLKLVVLAGAAVFALFVFVTMVGTSCNFGDSISYNCYQALGTTFLGQHVCSGTAIAGFVLYVIALVALLACVASYALKKYTQYAKFVTLGACLFFLVAGILWFCCAAGDFENGSLGVGAVFTALYNIFAAIGCGFVGVSELLNK